MTSIISNVINVYSILNFIQITHNLYDELTMLMNKVSQFFINLIFT